MSLSQGRRNEWCESSVTQRIGRLARIKTRCVPWSASKHRIRRSTSGSPSSPRNFVIDVVGSSAAKRVDFDAVEACVGEDDRAFRILIVLDANRSDRRVESRQARWPNVNDERAGLNFRVICEVKFLAFEREDRRRTETQMIAGRKMCVRRHDMAGSRAHQRVEIEDCQKSKNCGAGHRPSPARGRGRRRCGRRKPVRIRDFSRRCTFAEFQGVHSHASQPRFVARIARDSQVGGGRRDFGSWASRLRAIEFANCPLLS